MATIKDVARLARVSTATVSATINKTAYVSAPLQARVEAAIKDLGYAPSTVARSLKMGRTKLIGIIVPELVNPFFAELVQAVERAAQALGYTLLLCNSTANVARELDVLRLMQMQRADGIILVPAGTADDYERAGLAQFPVPVVLVERRIERLAIPCVGVDNEAAGAHAARHLIGLGHRRIATIAGPQEISTGRDRLAGFCEVLREAGLPIDPAHAPIGAFRPEVAQAACRRLMQQSEPPTALFVADNQMLLGVVRALAELGIICPGQVSVLSVDDAPWMAAVSPAYSVIRQPVAVMGERALDLLLRRIDKSVPSESQTVLLAPELIIRESCTPPAAA